MELSGGKERPRDDERAGDACAASDGSTPLFFLGSCPCLEGSNESVAIYLSLPNLRVVTSCNSVARILLIVHKNLLVKQASIKENQEFILSTKLGMK